MITSAAGCDSPMRMIRWAAEEDFIVLAFLRTRTQHRGTRTRSNPPKQSRDLCGKSQCSRFAITPGLLLPSPQMYSLGRRVGMSDRSAKRFLVNEKMSISPQSIPCSDAER